MTTHPNSIIAITGTRVKHIIGFSHGFMAPAMTEATVVEESYHWAYPTITVRTDDGFIHRVNPNNCVIVQRAEGPTRF